MNLFSDFDSCIHIAIDSNKHVELHLQGFIITEVKYQFIKVSVYITKCTTSK